MNVVLVDTRDVQTGIMEKIEAHEKALLHRAFSVFIFNKKGEMLLQKRAASKYHSAGLWTNACCSHPQPGDNLLESASKRLNEEMGFTAILHKAFDFIYKEPFDNGLTEHEFDHVFIGSYDGQINPNEEEVSEFCHKSLEEIKKLLVTHPQQYTAWFRIAFPRVEEYFLKAVL